MRPLTKPLRPRKLLVASIGVASMSWVAGLACDRPAASGNAVTPLADARVAPPSTADAAAPPDGRPDLGLPTSGNLMPPPPPEDAGAARVSPDLSPGEAWVAIAGGAKPTAIDGGAALPPDVVRLVPDAVKRMKAEHENVARHDVRILMEPGTIELVFLPRLAPG